MKIVGPVTVEAVQKHLDQQKTGVKLNLKDMPGPVSGYAAFRATLEDSDIDRIFLWFEFRKHTKDGSAKLTDSLPESLAEKRFKRIIEGDPERGWGPIDLHTPGFAPTLLTQEANRGMLYGIDGNHRLMAQFLTKKSFDDAPVYIVTHPKMLEWAYIPQTAKVWVPKPLVIHQGLADRLDFSQGLNGDRSNSEGELLDSNSSREDRRRWTGCRVDFSGAEPRLIVTGERLADNQRTDNTTDENEAAVTFAATISRQQGVEFVAVPKEEEDSDFPDVWIQNRQTCECVGVQIRNFDMAAVAGMGRDAGFDFEITVPEVARSIVRAIDAKGSIDRKLASESYLLLICPYPLPATIHLAIAGAVATLNPEQRYMETWVASRGEPAFRVQPASAASTPVQ